jgi:hypothetical protein
MSVRRQFADLLGYINPFSANVNLASPPPLLQDENIPARKRPRLESSTTYSISTAEDAGDADIFVDAVQTTDTVTTASLNATVPEAAAPADAVTVTVTAASIMEGTTDEDFIPTENEKNIVRMSGTMRRKAGKRTFPWESRAAANIASPPLSPQDEDIPAAKNPLLETFTSFFTATNASPTATVAFALTDTVTDVAASLPSTVASCGLAASLPSTVASCEFPFQPAYRKWIQLPAYRQWTAEEDAQLSEAVNQLGQIWVNVAPLFPGRTNAQCSLRWRTYLDPTVIVHSKTALYSTWTVEEDAKLKEAVTEHGYDWCRVAAQVPGRTNVQCRYRWVETLDSDVENGTWTVEDDAKLTRAVREIGQIWAVVAALFPDRTSAQCSLRWRNHFDPRITIDQTAAVYSKWTVEEDEKLTKAVRELGYDWLEISLLVPGRSRTQCRQRWLESLDPDINRVKWGIEEDVKLNEAVQNSVNNWNEDAAPVTLQQANTQSPNWVGYALAKRRARWYNCMDLAISPTTVTNTKWTPEEDTTLIEAVQQHGNNWVAVAALVPGRTNNQCSERWHKYVNATLTQMPADNYKWTPEEDAKLFEAVQYYGNNWVAVAALVPGRTNDQCYGRWRICFALTRMTAQTTAPNSKWTVEEDATLIEAPQQRGNNWVAVASLVPDRTNNQYSESGRRELDRIIDQTTAPYCEWTVEEDAKLTEAVTEFENDWVRVAGLVPGRANGQCRQRWARSLNPDFIPQYRKRWAQSLNPDINNGKWTVEEDAKLTEAVTELGDNWLEIAALVPGRTNGQCRQRWARILNPDIKNGEWSLEEDVKLIEGVKQFGDNNWVQIGALVPGRTNTQCSERWRRQMDPTTDHTIAQFTEWTVEEDVKLAEAVTEVGNDWFRVGALVPGRTQDRCRQRWARIFHSEFNKDKWTVEEDSKLIDGVKQFGDNNWVRAGALVPGRTDVQCHNRWKVVVDDTIDQLNTEETQY